MSDTNNISMSILKGDKLLNENTPFVINLSAPQPNENDKKCNVDLICVIDVSGSMFGEKIDLVKESLKILLSFLDEKDRLCLILFESDAKYYYNLNFLTKNNKEILEEKINNIRAGGGTNILSGLKLAVDVIKNQTYNEKRVSSILLLSDGCDNESNDIELANSLKQMTKGLGLSFTLHTFGYGDDHDAKVMNKLANLRDGSFFYVKEYSKVAEYFVSVLGACISVISKKLDLKLQALNNDCKIIKAYGAQNLFYHETTEKYFKTAILQFICGKEYTFVIDIFVDETKVKIDEEILKLEISYEDIEQNNKKIQKEIKYKYHLKDTEYIKANEEFIRAYVYSILDEAIKLKDKKEYTKGKQILEDLEKWLSSKDKVKNEKYIKEIQEAKGLFSEYSYNTLGLYNNLNCYVQNNMFKRMDINNINCNCVQQAMINSIPRQNISQKPKPNNSYNNNNNNLFGNMNYQYSLNMNQAPLFQNMNQLNSFQNMNQAPLFQNMNQPNSLQNMNQAPLFQNINQPNSFQNMNQAPLFQNMNQPYSFQYMNQAPNMMQNMNSNQFYSNMIQNNNSFNNPMMNNKNQINDIKNNQK